MKLVYDGDGHRPAAMEVFVRRQPIIWCSRSIRLVGVCGFAALLQGCFATFDTYVPPASRKDAKEQLCSILQPGGHASIPKGIGTYNSGEVVSFCAFEIDGIRFSTGRPPRTWGSSYWSNPYKDRVYLVPGEHTATARILYRTREWVDSATWTRQYGNIVEHTTRTAGWTPSIGRSEDIHFAFKTVSGKQDNQIGLDFYQAYQVAIGYLEANSDLLKKRRMQGSIILPLHQ